MLYLIKTYEPPFVKRITMFIRTKDEIVGPSRSLPSPETSVPGKYLLLDGAEQNEDETDRGELSQNPKRHAQPSRCFGDTKKDGESLAHFNTLRPILGI